MPIAAIEHIEVDDKSVARIAGSRISVMHLVSERQSYGVNIEQLHEWHPHISIASIYAAFAYYHDHKEEIDQQIIEMQQMADDLRAKQESDPKIQKLREAMKRRC